jgi:hypothetical protein
VTDELYSRPSVNTPTGFQAGPDDRRSAAAGPQRTAHCHAAVARIPADVLTTAMARAPWVVWNPSMWGGRLRRDHHGRRSGAIGGGVFGPVQGPVAVAYRIRLAGVPGLVRHTRLGAAGRGRVHLELYVRWMQEVRRFNRQGCRGGCRWSAASTAPA